MTEDEADEVKNAFEQLSEEWESKRDDIHEAKIEEIDNAYNNWLGEIGKKEIARMEDEAAHGHQVSTRINLNDIN
jgi:hypothetical protein